MRRMFSYILFDWDGCLANTLQIWMESYKKVFALFGFYPSEKDIAEKVFGKWDGNRVIGVTDDEMFRERLFKEVNYRLIKAKLFDHVYETLHSLRNSGKKLALLSSSPKVIVNKAMKLNNVTDLFEINICHEDVTNHKPNPEGVNRIIKFFKADKKDFIMVGDADKDVEACHNAGISSCLFYP